MLTNSASHRNLGLSDAPLPRNPPRRHVSRQAMTGKGSRVADKTQRICNLPPQSATPLPSWHSDGFPTQNRHINATPKLFEPYEIPVMFGVVAVFFRVGGIKGI